MSNAYKCSVCGDRFTNEDIKELVEMGEPFHLDKDQFRLICPDCYDNLNRLSLERQFEILMKGSDPGDKS